MKDPNAVMKGVMKTAEKILRERPDLRGDPNLPLIRKKHPEWFDDERRGRGQVNAAYRCSHCGNVIDVTRDKYWASTNLICDPCWQSFPICSDFDGPNNIDAKEGR